jgi:hypothetical protein
MVLTPSNSYNAQVMSFCVCFCLHASMKNNVTLVSTMRCMLQPLRGLQSAKLVRVALCLLDLCSCATPDMPEAGAWEWGETANLNPLSHMASTAPSRSTHTPARDNRCSLGRSSPPSLDFPSPLWVGKDTKSIAPYGAWLALPPPH